VATTDHKYW